MPPPTAPTQPAELPRWATSPTLSAPSSGRLDTGFAPAERPPARWLNWLWNRNYQWANYAKSLGDYATTYFNSAFDGTVSRTRQVNLLNGRATPAEWEWVANPSIPFRVFWQALFSEGYLFIPLDRPDPGALYTQVVVRAKPVSARASGSRMKAHIVSISSTGEVTVESSQIEDDGTTNEQNITVPITGTPSSSLSYAVMIFAGTGLGGGSTQDRVFGVTATYNDPTPRRPL